MLWVKRVVPLEITVNLFNLLRSQDEKRILRGNYGYINGAFPALSQLAVKSRVNYYFLF